MNVRTAGVAALAVAGVIVAWALFVTTINHHNRSEAQAGCRSLQAKEFGVDPDSPLAAEGYALSHRRALLLGECREKGLLP